MKLCNLIFPLTLLSAANSKGFPNEEQLFRKSTNSMVEVCAKAGCIRGKVESGRMKSYDAFYGIPYAEPPIGTLRFENPVPKRSWSGYWDATYPRDGCLQRNVFISTQPIYGSEDCLYLNVYRPISWKYGKKLPIMIYIHGGSWISFTSSPKEFGPEYLMDNGEVILVTMDYRLGIFGLLCSGDEAVKGNFAFKDQQLAIKWVVDNVEYFGGDTSSITLFGESAGAASVHLHVINPSSAALFHRAILMSGTALSPWSYIKDFKEQFREAAKFVGITNWETASTFDLAQQLKKVDPLTVALAIDDFFVFISTPVVPMGICIEGNWKDAFMQEDPRIIWAEGRYTPKPILIGTTADEGDLAAIITLNETVLAEFNANIYKLLPILLTMDSRYVSDVLQYYLGGKDYVDINNREQFLQMIADRWFVYPMTVLVNQFIGTVDVKKTPIYIYEFDFTGPYSWIQVFTGLDVNFGVGHIDDLFYLFTMSEFIPQFNTTSAEGKMVDVYVRTMVNFATKGEVKVWRKFSPCTTLTSKPFCDRQIFQRNTNLDPNQVEVLVTNEVDEGMLRLWSKIDNGVTGLN